MKSIQILDAASQDLKAGFHFYEKQGAGLGGYFLDALFSDIDSLLIYAGIHPTYFKKYRRLLSKRFPFAIYYCEEGSKILVYAILDCRKNPTWLKKRLG